MKKKLFLFFLILVSLSLFNLKEKKSTLKVISFANNEDDFSLSDWQASNDDIVFLLKFQKEEKAYLIPVVYTEDDPEFYFRKALDLNYSSMGSAFIDRYSSLESYNLIINAHSSKEKDTQFTFLKNYIDEDYFYQNLNFKLISNQGIYLCTVYSFSEYDLNDADVYPIWYFNPKNKKDLFKLLALTEPYQIHQNPISSDFERIITLVTCNMNKENSRYVLQAIVKKEE